MQGKLVQLRYGFLLDGFQIFIIPAQIAINAVLQFGALQNTICFLCCGCPGILKIAPAGIQNALYGAKISFQRDTSVLYNHRSNFRSMLRIRSKTSFANGYPPVLSRTTSVKKFCISRQLSM